MKIIAWPIQRSSVSIPAKTKLAGCLSHCFGYYAVWMMAPACVRYDCYTTMTMFNNHTRNAYLLVILGLSALCKALVLKLGSQTIARSHRCYPQKSGYPSLHRPQPPNRAPCLELAETAGGSTWASQNRRPSRSCISDLLSCDAAQPLQGCASGHVICVNLGQTRHLLLSKPSGTLPD